MNKIFIFLISMPISILIHAKNIQIDTLIDHKAINCGAIFKHPESKITTLLNDFSADGSKTVKLNKVKQTLMIGKNTYFGVQGYQYYETKNTEQHDLAVNLDIHDVNLMKIAIQGAKSKDGESGSYYFIFRGMPSTVLFHLLKRMENDWNIENTLEETPQGNTKLMCVYAG